MEIIITNGECNSVVETVLDKWEKDSANLFSMCSGSFDDAFLKEMIRLKEIMQSEMIVDCNSGNMFLNADFPLKR